MKKHLIIIALFIVSDPLREIDAPQQANQWYNVTPVQIGFRPLTGNRCPPTFWLKPEGWVFIIVSDPLREIDAPQPNQSAEWQMGIMVSDPLREIDAPQLLTFDISRKASIKVSDPLREIDAPQQMGLGWVWLFASQSFRPLTGNRCPPTFIRVVTRRMSVTKFQTPYGK